jgi:hypothetical protein
MKNTSCHHEASCGNQPSITKPVRRPERAHPRRPDRPRAVGRCTAAGDLAELGMGVKDRGPRRRQRPPTVPAHPAFLRKVLGRAAPKAIGIGQASWNNARSLCGKALEWAGLASVPGHYLAPFAPAWAELWACLPPEGALRHQIGRLFHYASAQRIAPNEINDAVLATFHQALETESIVPDPYEIWRGSTRLCSATPLLARAVANSRNCLRRFSIVAGRCARVKWSSLRSSPAARRR